MGTNSGIWTETFGAIGTSLSALEKRGVTKEHLARLRTDKHYARLVAESMVGGVVRPSLTRPKSTHEPGPNEAQMLKLMGRNGFGIADVENYFGVEFTSKQKARLEAAITEEVLKILEECASTHICFPGFPMDLQEVVAKAPSGTFSKTACLKKDSFRSGKDAKVDLEWYIVGKEVIPGSLKKWPREFHIKPKDEPWVCEMVYAMLLNYLVTGERLQAAGWCLNNGWDRANWNEGVPFYVFHGTRGVEINHPIDPFRYNSIGVFSFRKFG